MNLEWVKQPVGFLKVLALALSVTNLALYLDYGGGFWDRDLDRFAVVVVPSTVLVLFYFVLSYVFDSNAGKCVITELVFDIAHGISNVILASFSLKHADNNSDGTVSFAVLLLLAGVALLVDAYFVFKKRN